MTEVTVDAAMMLVVRYVKSRPVAKDPFESGFYDLSKLTQPRGNLIYLEQSSYQIRNIQQRVNVIVDNNFPMYFPLT